jgi:hypothetical protein
MKVEARQKPFADERSHDADRGVADEPEPVAAQHLADQPPDEGADNEDNDHALVGQMHGSPSAEPYSVHLG